MKKYIILISILFISCSDKNKSGEKKELNKKVDTLTFSTRAFNSGHKLKLTTNNHFIDETNWASCLGGGGAKKVFGTYKTRDGKITLKPTTVENINYPIVEGDTILKKNKFDYNPDSLKINTEYFLIEWRQNKYLLSENVFPPHKGENDFMRFARYFNSESRRFKFDGFLYKDKQDNCDTINSNFNYNQIPNKWRKYFLTKPIIAKIEKTKKIGEVTNGYSSASSWLVEINKGTEDNVYNGLYFTSNTSRLNLEIDSTFQNKSYSSIILLKNEKLENLIGDKELRTKWK